MSTQGFQTGCQISPYQESIRSIRARYARRQQRHPSANGLHVVIRCGVSNPGSGHTGFLLSREFAIYSQVAGALRGTVDLRSQRDRLRSQRDERDEPPDDAS